MGCAMIITRSVVSLVLGVVVFFGFLFLLLLNNFSDKMLSAEFYSDTIAEEDTYNRIYDEVLLDSELENTTSDLLGDFQVVNQVEIVELLREIIPPAYLQSQVEGSIQRTVDYFNEDLDFLDLSVALGPPLNSVKPVLFRYIDRRIDGLAEEDLGQLECTPQRVSEVAQLYENRWTELAGGTVPASVPSLQTFTPACRQAIFSLAFQSVVEQSSLDERAKQGLLNERAGIERTFVDGDTRGVLKLAARPLATPLMDDAILRIQEELDDQDRLDLIHQLAVWNDDFSEAELRSDIDSTRDWLNWGQKFGKAVALAMLIAGSALLALVHYPSLKNGMRWPGLTLFLTGVVFFAVGKVLESQLPDRLQDLVERSASQVSGIPASVTDLGGDLLVSFGNQLTTGIAAPALTLLIIGALLFGASFFVNYVILLLKLISTPFNFVLIPLRLLRRGKPASSSGAAPPPAPPAPPPPPAPPEPPAPPTPPEDPEPPTPTDPPTSPEPSASSEPPTTTPPTRQSGPDNQ